MKTAEELYNKILDDDEFKSFPDGLMCMGQFKKALAEYRQSIMGIIDEMIKKYRGIYDDIKQDPKQDYYELGMIEGKYYSLTELKQKIQSL